MTALGPCRAEEQGRGDKQQVKKPDSGFGELRENGAIWLVKDMFQL